MEILIYIAIVVIGVILIILGGERITPILLGAFLIFFGFKIIFKPKYFNPIYEYFFDFSSYNIPLGIFMIIVGVLFTWTSLKKKKIQNEKSFGGSMLEAEKTGELRKGMRTLWIIWSAMVGSLAIYIIVCHVMADKINVNMGPNFPFEVFRNILYIIALVELVVIYLMRKLMLKVPIYKKGLLTVKETPEVGYQSVLNKYTSALVTSLAIADSIGIYGIVLFFIDGNFQDLYVFIIVSAIAMFIYRPKTEEIEKLAAAMEGLIT